MLFFFFVFFLFFFFFCSRCLYFQEKKSLERKKASCEAFRKSVSLKMFLKLCSFSHARVPFEIPEVFFSENLRPKNETQYNIIGTVHPTNREKIKSYEVTHDVTSYTRCDTQTNRLTNRVTYGSVQQPPARSTDR